MLCYKDKTFCNYYEDCKSGKDCKRALTDEVKEKAEIAKLLVCIFAEKPECYEDKK